MCVLITRDHTVYLLKVWDKCWSARLPASSPSSPTTTVLSEYKHDG